VITNQVGFGGGMGFGTVSGIVAQHARLRRMPGAPGRGPSPGLPADYDHGSDAAFILTCWGCVVAIYWCVWGMCQ
jgi:hypothetical protein